MKSQTKGFSLLELLVVTAIIGILVAIAIPMLMDALDKAKQRATVADMRNWGTGLAAYYAEKSSYPGVSGGPVDASTIHPDLVPFAVSALHDDDPWHNPIQYYTNVTDAYTLQGCGKIGDCMVPPDTGCPAGCVTPLTWQNFDLDIILNDGIFTYSP